MRQWFDGEVELWDVRLGLAHESEIVEFVWLQTRLGVLGGMHQQDYEIGHEGLAFGDAVDDFFRASQRLSEQLDTWFIGPYVGLGLDTQITSRLSASVDVEVALLWHQTTLDAQQDLVALTFGLTGSSFGCTIVLTDCAFDVEESDRTAGFGVRPRIRAGLDYDLGSFLIGLSGGVTYWSDAPQVVNPQLRPGLAGSERAHISGDDLWVADLGLQITVPFGRTRLQGGERAVALVDGLTLETTGHAVYVNAPDVEGLGIVTLDSGLGGPSPTSVLNDEADVSTIGGGFDGRAGFAVGDDSDWSVELGGSYAKAEEDDKSTADFGGFGGGGLGGFASPVPVNGLVALGYVNLGGPVEQRIDGEVQQWDVRAGAALDVDVAAGVSGKARAGLVGGMLDQDYEIEHRPTRYPDVGGGGPPPFYLGSHRLDERVESWFVGPYLGFALEGEPLDRLSVSLDFDLALLYHQADLDARQDVVGFMSGPTLSCDGASGTDCRFEFRERDKDEDFTARPRLRAGVDVDLGPFIVGLSAGVTWWSHVPKIENPQVGSFAPSEFEEARIGSGDMLTADAGLKITIPFGR
jgi:hypothetical protein